MPDLADKYENFVDIYTDGREKDNLERLLGDAKTEENARQRNIMNSERWYKKRFGIRPQFVTWPWRNASNLHMPLTDKTIRRSKPSFANMVGTQYPTVVLESNILGDDQKIIRGVERVFHEMLFDEDKMNVFLDVCWGIDLMLERGRFVTKTIQEFTPTVRTEEVILSNMTPEMRQFLLAPNTTDEMIALEMIMRWKLDVDDEWQNAEIRHAVRQLRDGKDTIRFERKINLTPYPTLCVRDPNSILFPQNTSFMISRAQWIRDRILLDSVGIEDRISSGMWDKTNGRLLLERVRVDDRFVGDRSVQNALATPSAGPERYEMQREGVSPSGPSSVFGVDEFYFWKKMPGSSLAERMVLTIHPDHPDLPLRLIRYPYVLPDGRPEDWPFDQVQFEICGDRAYSPRGYPQLLDSLQTEITNNHNAKQNWMTIANSLNIKAKRNSGVTTSFVPGQPLWCNRMDDVDQISIASRDMSFDNEERILKGWAEEYIGLLDQTLTNMSGQPERRTKAEIDAVSALQAQVASLDVRVFQACMQRVYRRIWNRWMQYGEDTIDVQMPDGTPKAISKESLKKRLKLRTVGDVFSTNRQLRASRMGNIFQMLRGDPRIDQDRLYLAWLSLEDERLAEEVLISGAQAQQAQIDQFIKDVQNINTGYTVIPRPQDDNQLAVKVVQDFLQDPVKRRNFHPDRLQNLKDFHDAHMLAAQKKAEATTRPGRMEQEVANTAQGMSGRAARNAT